MEKYYKPNFNYLDVEYHIFYHDNESGLLSSSSDGQLFFAFKMDSSELVKISTQETTDSFELTSRVNFLPSTKTWNTDFPKTYYKSGDVIIWENKILLRAINNN